MYKLHTKKQELYFDEVIRLHYEKGYGEDRISTIIPVGHTTVNRWIRIFAAGKETEKTVMPETKIKEKRKISESAESETVPRAEYERLKAAQESFAPGYVRSVRERDPGIGGVKLWMMYVKAFAAGHPMGRDRFCEMIDRCDRKIRRRIRAPRTTDSGHGLPTYPNLVKSFIPAAPNQLWVIDMTYIMITLGDGCAFCYLTMAFKRIEGLQAVPIHHSDRGCQYASREYVGRLKGRGISISMTECGDPKDNAQAERVNSTMKNELLKGMVFHDIYDVRRAVSRAVDFYNNERPHMSLDMMTSAEASSRTGEIARRWRSYRQEAIKKSAACAGCD